MLKISEVTWHNLNILSWRFYPAPVRPNPVSSSMRPFFPTFFRADSWPCYISFHNETVHHVATVNGIPSSAYNGHLYVPKCQSSHLLAWFRFRGIATEKRLVVRVCDSWLIDNPWSGGFAEQVEEAWQTAVRCVWFFFFSVCDVIDDSFASHGQTYCRYSPRLRKFPHFTAVRLWLNLSNCMFNSQKWSHARTQALGWLCPRRYPMRVLFRASSILKSINLQLAKILVRYRDGRTCGHRNDFVGGIKTVVWESFWSHRASRQPEKMKKKKTKSWRTEERIKARLTVSLSGQRFSLVNINNLERNKLFGLKGEMPPTNRTI